MKRMPRIVTHTVLIHFEMYLRVSFFLGVVVSCKLAMQ